ncbi:purine nucleosidase [Lactobacillus selangorensis]|uniref:Purine nucleosidase n=1 Tax=Lactobacillus selangorensis TaxID=81857 RepID=A0A0R2FUW6_9LACO|nr:nucleoside hydrolase [Lactobacillus selangorensis]KRN29034.1 purine nucleosidase [Lactobacillus selangorensis]KRN30052.1 purine nucleosidase [Lactobacillus selangorensis]
MAKQKMILDLDTGIDDALAIAYAVASPEADLIGILSSYGNVVVERSAKNSLRILDLLGASDVPVFLGESHSVVTDHFDVMPISAQIHGKNGIGEVAVAESSRAIESESAVDFIIDAAHKYKQDLILVPTGPLTNLAAAIRKDPSIVKEIGKVVLMGGALTVPGNVTDAAEANINQDAVSANEVFTAGLNLTMVGLDVTLRTLLTRKETQQWRDLHTKAGDAFADIVDFYIKAYEITSPGLNGCALHDPLAVGVALMPDLVTTLPLNMIVETEGTTWGRTTGDANRLNEPSTDQASLTVDADRFLNLFMTRLSKLFEEN